MLFSKGINKSQELDADSLFTLGQVLHEHSAWPWSTKQNKFHTQLTLVHWFTVEVMCLQLVLLI